MNMTTEQIIAEREAKTVYGLDCNLTPAQARVAARLCAEIFKSESHSIPEKYEFKRCELSQCGSMVYLYTVVGLKGDEGTMASIFCRDTRHIMIGKNGGCRLLNARQSSKAKGFWNCVHRLTGHEMKPVEKARRIFSQNPELSRKELIAKCVEAGINAGTAATQYAKWKKA